MTDERILIDGPAGPLEVWFTGNGSSTAVLSHPHPLYGGSMHDAVLGVAAGVLNASGFRVLRFNFRGVGASAGQHDQGIGETDDLAAVVRFAMETADTPILLGGYSFGAAITGRLMSRSDAPAVSRMLLIAPPVPNLPIPQPDGRVPTEVIVGTADPFADLSELRKWSHARLHTIEGADHFFSGAQRQLEQAVEAALAS